MYMPYAFCVCQTNVRQTNIKVDFRVLFLFGSTNFIFHVKGTFIAAIVVYTEKLLVIILCRLVFPYVLLVYVGIYYIHI